MQTSLARRQRRRRNGRGRFPGRGRRTLRGDPPDASFSGAWCWWGPVGFVGAVDIYTTYGRDLQDPRQLLQSINFNQQTILYDKTGTVQLAAYGSENRRVLTFDEIPDVVLDATTSAEDKTFWTNEGFDPAAVLSAFRDALSGNPRGASTITQQLVRAELLPPTTSLMDRKIKEIIQSVKLTQEFPGLQGKETIITDYLNLNFYGNQSYGIAAAAQGYFGITDLSQLTIAQARDPRRASFRPRPPTTWFRTRSSNRTARSSFRPAPRSCSAATRSSRTCARTWPTACCGGRTRTRTSWPPSLSRSSFIRSPRTS